MSVRRYVSFDIVVLKAIEILFVEYKLLFGEKTVIMGGCVPFGGEVKPPRKYGFATVKLTDCNVTIVIARALRMLKVVLWFLLSSSYQCHNITICFMLKAVFVKLS